VGSKAPFAPQQETPGPEPEVKRVQNPQPHAMQYAGFGLLAATGKEPAGHASAAVSTQSPFSATNCSEGHVVGCELGTSEGVDEGTIDKEGVAEGAGDLVFGAFAAFAAFGAFSAFGAFRAFDFNPRGPWWAELLCNGAKSWLLSFSPATRVSSAK
jgi:hypothetical protein